MPQPTAYQRTVDFTERDGDDTNHGGINAELDAAALSVNQIRANLALIQKDDGTLANGSVGAEQLAAGAFDAVQASVNAATQAASGSAQSALTSALSAQQAATDAAQTISTVQQHAAAALLNAQSASVSASAASSSAASATGSAASATASQGAAAASASSAEASASAALASQTAAATSATNAGDSAGSAATSQAAAATSASSAATSAAAATTSQSAAATSAAAALASQGAAATSAAEAAASALSVDAANLVQVTGDQSIGGVKTLLEFPILPASLSGFAKADQNRSAFIKTGATTVSIRAETRVEIAGRWHRFEVQTAVPMPALVAGEDYAIWCTPDGALACNADPFSSPAAPPVGGSRKIGGFHYGLVAPGTTVAGGGFATTGFTNQGGSMIWTQAAVDRIAGINEFSLWDLAWRCKGQQRGMVLDPQTESWHAIYFCGANHIVNGISRFNTDVASGTVLPRIPLAYGGNGTLAYGRMSQYEAEEIASSFNLRMPDPHEFRSAAFGVTEFQSLGGAAATIPSTLRQSGYTSRLGIEQATGHQWIWARGNSSTGAVGWIAGPHRGDAHNNLFVTLLGGDRNNAAHSGSRASNSSNVAWPSNWAIALRAAGDHLKHV